MEISFFIIGGFNESGVVEEVEVMNTKTQRWEMMKVTMKTRRSDMGVAVIGDLIFHHW